MNKDKKSTMEQKKRKGHFTRVILLVLVFCITVVTALVVSDLFLSDDKESGDTPELVAVTVYADSLVLNEGRIVTLDELREYMTELNSSGKTFVGSIINDMANPADATLYNQVVDLFAEFDIFCEKLPQNATRDEQIVVTPDEV